tara:strand:- start:154 stop:1071 length:918 start_codon:yes stop_codon:yes gene_type:complete
MWSLDKWRENSGNPITEVAQCRQQAALFDFSFMSRARVNGVGARQLVNNFVSRDVTDMPENRVTYCLRLNHQSYVTSDLTVWKLEGNGYEVMSGNADDIAALMSQRNSNCSIEDLSDSHSVFAVQGPESLLRLAKLGGLERLFRLEYFEFCDLEIADLPVRVARLGYTGERGFELLVRRADAQALWYLLTQEFPVASYAAMDILRIEAGFIFYCNECSIGATPIEMGLVQFAGEETDQNLSSELKLACFTARHHECPVLWQHSKSNPPHPTRGEIVVTSACFSRCPKRFSAWVISTQKMSPLGRL